VVAYANLGGLGAREGRPVVHTWEPPPPEPPQMSVAASTSLNLLPSLLILLPLFLFRPNRSPKAWWIWLPAVISGLAGITTTCLTTDNDRSLAQAVVCSFTVGLAAMWLLMPFLGSRYRIVAFFKALPVLAGFSLLAFVPTLLADHSGWLDFRPFLAGLLALGSLAATLALTLGGLSVRRRFGRIRFLCWLAVWTMLAWAIIATPFGILASLESHIDWGEACLALLAVSGLTLALLLPLVLLSFFQPFYRARFLAFLNLPQLDPSAGATTPPSIPDLAQPLVASRGGRT
jgi:hypothetical protein